MPEYRDKAEEALEQARRRLNDPDERDEVQFHLASAIVYALADVARAVRQIK